MMFQIVVGPQFQNCMSLCYIFTCLRASENLDCLPKMCTQKSFYLTFLKVEPEIKFVP